MGGLEVSWTEGALEEFADILNFYNGRNKSNIYSKSLKAHAEYITDLISNFPRIGKISGDDHTRVFGVDKFLLLYEFDEKKVSILSFWDPKRDQMKRVIHRKKPRS